jgi:hypothetical protein
MAKDSNEIKTKNKQTIIEESEDETNTPINKLKKPNKISSKIHSISVKLKS